MKNAKRETTFISSVLCISYFVLSSLNPSLVAGEANDRHPIDVHVRSSLCVYVQGTTQWRSQSPSIGTRVIVPVYLTVSFHGETTARLLQRRRHTTLP